MEKWVCTVCGYVYDPEIGDPDSGVEPGTSFEDLPDDWTCPDCGVAKDMFEKEQKILHIFVQNLGKGAGVLFVLGETYQVK